MLHLEIDQTSTLSTKIVDSIRDKGLIENSASENVQVGMKRTCARTLML